VRRGLLERYSPLLRYHPQEPYRADSPAAMTDVVVPGRYATRLVDTDGRLIASAQSTPGVPLLSLAFLRGRDYPDGGGTVGRSDRLAPHPGTWQQDAAAMHRRPGIADRVYGRAREAGGRVWLQYWLFYYYNDKSIAHIGLHEGDWEMVQVGLDPDGRPAVATYSQHAGGERRDWKDVETVGGSGGGAPVVYVSLGSHANYFTPGEYWVRPFPLRDHASAGGDAVRPTLERLTNDLGWLQWPGEWGSSGSPNDSPEGPGHHEKQWHRPDQYHADARGPRRRKVLGTILVAEEERRTPAPTRLSARRVGDRVRITYELPRLDPDDPFVPVRILLSVQRASGAVPPVTHSFDVTTRRATVEHPAVLGRGRYRVSATAFSREDSASPLVQADVAEPRRRRARPPGGGPAALAAAAGAPIAAVPPGEAAVPLRLLVRVDDPKRWAKRDLERAVRALGRDAAGDPWRVERLFARGAPPRLARYWAVTGLVPASPAYPPSRLAFDLARTLAEAGGMEVHPDLPSSAYAPPDGVSLQPAAAAAAAPPARWATDAIDCPAAWRLDPTRGAGIVIAHPDTGYTAHPELEGGALDLARDRDVLSGDDEALDPLERRWWWPFDTPGHGTATGSVIVGRPAGQLVGAAPGATLVPIRTVTSVVQVLDGDLAQAVDHARRIRADVISMSLGGEGFLPVVQDAIAAAVQEGAIVLAAAGNYVSWVVSPARFPECLAVAATGVGGRPWQHSSSGAAVDFSAPGEDVWVATATRRDGRVSYGRGTASGTSFAVALAAGTAALWLARHGRAAIRSRYGPSGVQAAFLHLARATATRGRGWDAARYGAGILDAGALLEAPLPAPSAVAGAAAGRAGAGRRTPVERVAAATPELTTTQLRRALARVLGCPVRQVDARLERLGGEIHRMLLEDRELRSQLVAGAGEPAATGAGGDLRDLRGRMRAQASGGLSAELPA
jgi:hypothetical protein